MDDDFRENESENLRNCPEDYPEKLSDNEIEQRFRQLLGDFKQPSVPLDIEIREEENFNGIVRQNGDRLRISPMR